MKPSEEVAALWREMFGEPPPITADVEMLSRVLVSHMTPAPPYQPKPIPCDAEADPSPASRKA